MIDEMIKRFGTEHVIGYLTCCIYKYIKTANEYHAMRLYNNRDVALCDLVLCISEYERITGETLPREDIYSELIWFPTPSR